MYSCTDSHYEQWEPSSIYSQRTPFYLKGTELVTQWSLRLGDTSKWSVRTTKEMYYSGGLCWTLPLVNLKITVEVKNNIYFHVPTLSSYSG